MIFSYEKLKSKRLAQMQQEELAERTGISLSIIKNIESGRKKITLNSPELIKICEVLNLIQKIISLDLRDQSHSSTTKGAWERQVSYVV